MNAKDAGEIVKLLGKLYQNQPLNAEQIQLAHETLLAFDFEAASRAAKAHKLAHEFLSWPQLLSGIRAEQAKALTSTNPSAREGSIADVYRRQYGTLSWGRKLLECGDAEVILRVMRARWIGAGQRESYRGQIERDAAAALVSIGWEAKAAASAGGCVTADKNVFEMACNETKELPDFSAA